MTRRRRGRRTWRGNYGPWLNISIELVFVWRPINWQFNYISLPLQNSLLNLKKFSSLLFLLLCCSRSHVLEHLSSEWAEGFSWPQAFLYIIATIVGAFKEYLCLLWGYKGSIGKGRRWGYKEKVLESRLLPRSSSTSPINQTELGGPVLILFNAISNVLDAVTVLVSVNVLATELYPISKFPFSTSFIPILLWPLWILWATAD